MQHSRQTNRVLLIGHSHPRYQNALAECAVRLRKSGCEVTLTSPRTWYGEEVLATLAEPRDLVIYFGHGRPGAWVGYARLNAETLRSVETEESHRLVASLSCDSLTEPVEGLALSTALLESGVVSRFVGYNDAVRFPNNESALSTVVGTYCDARESDANGVQAVVDIVGSGWAPSRDVTELQLAD